MQRGEQKIFSDRILFYLSRSISSQRRKGQKDIKVKDGKEVETGWDYHLMPVYGIFFQNFHLYGLKPRPVRTIQLKVRETGEIFSDKLTAYTLELCDYKGMDPKLCKTRIDYWLYNLANMMEINELAFQKLQPVFKQVNDLAEYAAMTQEEQDQYDRMEKYYLDYHAVMDFQYEKGLDKGMEEGGKEGVKQEKIATAKAMKDEGIPVDTIAKCTGLSVKDIQSL